MNKIKLIVSDMDGTLVQLQKHEVSDKVRNAVVATENAGIKVIPVTGRPYEMAKPVMTVLGFDSLCVVDNGASIHDVVTGELVWSRWLDLETVRQLVAIILPHAKSIDYAPAWEEHVPDPETEMKLVLEPAPYVFAFFPTQALPEIEAALKDIADIAYHVDPHSTEPTLSAIQVTNVEATKFYGVEALRGLIGIAKEETMAIGDGNNDLPLFENAGLKIAMGNATELLKAQADHIVNTVNEDGFAEAIDQYVLV